MKCMVQSNTLFEMDMDFLVDDQTEMDFLVDVSFESQDQDTAALVRGEKTITIGPYMAPHTIAGYLFTGLYTDVVSLISYIH